MAMLLEFLPIVGFFVALKLADVYVATGVAIAATLAAAVYQRVTKGKVAPMTIVSCVLMVVFGGLTIWLQDERFVKLKPTILMGVFALAFLVTRFVGEKPLAQRMLGAQFEAERPVWLRVNDGFTLFYAFVAGLNIWVAENFSTDTWANFKLFGLLILNVVVVIVAAMYLAKRGRFVAPPPTDSAPKSE